MRHFSKHWSEDLQNEVRTSAEQIVSPSFKLFFRIRGLTTYQFKARYEKLYRESDGSATMKTGRSPVSKIKTLLRELDSSDESDSDDLSGPSSAPSDPTKPWLKEYNEYLNTIDELPKGQTVVQWWGVS